MQLSQQRIDSIEDECKRAGVWKTYKKMVDAGESPSMAHMLAMRQVPAIKGTDSELMKRQNAKMNAMSDSHRRKIVHIAEQAGISTAGKVYEGQLGKYNDPAAWVSGPSDVIRAARQKNMHVPSLGVQATEYEPKPTGPKLAPDILKRLESEAIARDPKLKEKVKKNPSVRRELRSQLVEKHARKPR